MILHISAKTRHRKIHVRTPERLPKLIRISRKEISEGAKEIYAIESVRHVGTQPDAIYSSADLPEMFPSRARVGIAGLIVIFAALAILRIRPPERDQSSDVSLRTERLIRAQDCMASGGLKPQIANGFRA